MNHICPLCKGKKEIGTTTFTVDIGESLFVVRQVPAWVCSQCGETWIEDNIAERLEVMINDAKKFPKQVEIILFQDAA